MKFIVIFTISHLFFFTCISQEKAHKITYKYTIKLSKIDDPLLAFTLNGIKDKYIYKTFLCYKNQSICYNNDDDKEIKKVNELVTFVLNKNGKSFVYELINNDTYKVTNSNIKNESIKVIKDKIPYNGLDCKSIKFGINYGNTALSTNLYPAEWGCSMFVNYSDCILSLKSESFEAEVINDTEINSENIIRLFKQIESLKVNNVLPENNTVKLTKGNISLGETFPAYFIKDINGRYIDSNTPFDGIKVLFFWSDFKKDMPTSKALNAITDNMLLKEFNELALDTSLKVYSCFWGNKNDLVDYIPEYKKYKNLIYITSTLDWSINYLNISNLVTVVVTNGKNKILYKCHLNCIKGEVENLKNRIRSFR